MEHYYIIKINGWHMDYLKGTDEEFRSFLSSMKMTIIGESNILYQDMPFIYRKEYRISLPVYGVDWEFVKRKLNAVEDITGKMGDYVRGRIRDLIIRKYGMSVFENGSIVTIVSSDKEVPDGYVKTCPRTWEWTETGERTIHHIINERRHYSFSEYDENDFWDHMQTRLDLSKPE